MTVISQPLPDVPTLRVRDLPIATRARRHGLPNATIVARNDVTASLAVFVLMLDSPLNNFSAGQYVSLGLEHEDSLVQRPYSVVSCTEDSTRIELFVRRLPDGRFSNLMWAASPGDRIVVGPAKGLFVLNSDDRRPRVMVGTGTGIAPMIAMLDAACRDGDRTPTVLIFGSSFADEFPFSDRLEAWIARGLPLDYRPTISRPRENRNLSWVGRVGRAEAQLNALLDEWRWLRAGGASAYLCGNPDMVSACSKVLEAASFAAKDIRVELFHAPTKDALASDKQGGTASA